MLGQADHDLRVLDLDLDVELGLCDDCLLRECWRVPRPIRCSVEVVHMLSKTYRDGPEAQVQLQVQA
jgi:hypothetical protein